MSGRDRGRQDRGRGGRGRGRGDQGPRQSQYNPPDVYPPQGQQQRQPAGQPAPWGPQGSAPAWGAAPPSGRGASGYDYPPQGGMSMQQGSGGPPPKDYYQEPPPPGAFPPLGGGPPAPQAWGPPPGQFAPQPVQQYAPSPAALPMQEDYGGSQMSIEEYEAAPQQQAPQAPQAPQQQVQSIASKVLSVPERPRRPGFGSKGKQLKLLANWFKASAPTLLSTVEFKAPEVYQYAVHIKKLPYEEEEAGAGASSEPRRPARPPRVQDGPLPSILCRGAMAKLAEEMRWPPGAWAFDGRANMYAASVKVVPNDLLEKEVITTLPGERKPIKFEVKLERVAILSSATLKDFFNGRGDPTAPHHILQALDVVLKHRMGLNTLLRPEIMVQGRSFLIYDQRTQQQSLGGGAQVWLGYKQAIRPCQTGLALTVDTAAGAVWDVGNPGQPRKLSDLMYDILGGRDRVAPQGLNGHQSRMLDKELRGMRIQASHNGFKRTVVGVARNTPFNEKFAAANGQQTTVAAYFQSQYNVRISDQRLPCIKVGNGKSLLPAEVCVVLPKQRVGKLNGDQTANMIKHAAQRPQDKLRFIEQKVRDVQTEARSEMGTFGVSVGGKLTEVTGRVLPAPKLAYGGRNTSYDPKNFGSWNLKDVQFLEGKRADSWAVVNFASKRWEIEGVGPFVKEFSRVAKLCGVEMPREAPPLLAGRPGASVGPLLQRAVEDAVKKFRKRPDFILVVLPDTGAQLYREIKQAGDSGLGIPTQCIVAQKAKIGARDARPGAQVQYIANVALKVNAKLGGRNVALSPSTISSAQDFLKSFGTKPYMVFGADVTHPGIGSSMPSVAAVVGSLDATASRYACRISAQPASGRRQVEEIIVDLKSMAKDLLLEFYRATKGKRPERIFFYRDGVSEGQFDQVMAYEYEALREACSEMGDPGSNYAPPITFIIVQKRHQTRLFAKDPRDADRSGNVVPGVVIDRDICHPFEFDFYLNAHAGLQGTNKPAHLHVLIDQNKFTADALQEFTYWMSYLFCRCTRSISVPAPAQYAHLAAFRGRVLLSGGDSDAGSVASGEGPPPELLPVHPNLNSVMFFV